jgi:hypothetical protein
VLLGDCRKMASCADCTGQFQSSYSAMRRGFLLKRLGSNSDFVKFLPGAFHFIQLCFEVNFKAQICIDDVIMIFLQI